MSRKSPFENRLLKAISKVLKFCAPLFTEDGIVSMTLLTWPTRLAGISLTVKFCVPCTPVMFWMVTGMVVGTVNWPSQFSLMPLKSAWLRSIFRMYATRTDDSPQNCRWTDASNSSVYGVFMLGLKVVLTPPVAPTRLPRCAAMYAGSLLPATPVYSNVFVLAPPGLTAEKLSAKLK